MIMRSAGRFALVVVAAAVAGATPAIAQQVTNTDKQETAGQVALRKNVQLDPKQQLDEADHLIDGMKTTSQRISRMMWKAREAKDVVKAICTDDKASQADVAVRSATDRRRSLKAAVDSNDNAGANHEFTMIHTLAERNDQLIGEANQCIGEDGSGYVGDSKVTQSVDPTIADGDPDYPTTESTIVVDVARCSSCYR